MATKSKLEYIWLDGYEPTQSMRSKTMIRTNFEEPLMNAPCGLSMAHLPNKQRGDSDCLLKPVFICPDPDRINGFLVMCEVLNADGTPTPFQRKGDNRGRR